MDEAVIVGIGVCRDDRARQLRMPAMIKLCTLRKSSKRADFGVMSVPISRRSALALSAAGAVAVLGVGVGAGALRMRAKPGLSGRTVIRFSHVVAEDTPKGRAANHLKKL